MTSDGVFISSDLDSLGIDTPLVVPLGYDPAMRLLIVLALLLLATPGRADTKGPFRIISGH